MPTIKHIESGQVIAVSAPPKWENGIWECGDQRFMDADKTHYEAVEALEPLTPMTFYLAFKPDERIAIKSSGDAHVKEFWATYELAVTLDKTIDPNLASVQGAVAYLAQTSTDTPPGPGILASKDRIAQILAGIPQ